MIRSAAISIAAARALARESPSILSSRERNAYADILDEFNIVHNNVQTRIVTEQIAPANAYEITLLDFLSADPIHVDELVRMSGLPVAIISSTLTILELKGLARAVGYMQYCLIADIH